MRTCRHRFSGGKIPFGTLHEGEVLELYAYSTEIAEELVKDMLLQSDLVDEIGHYLEHLEADLKTPNNITVNDIVSRLNDMLRRKGVKREERTWPNQTLPKTLKKNDKEG